jgi:hypothetical protein
VPDAACSPIRRGLELDGPNVPFAKLPELAVAHAIDAPGGEQRTRRPIARDSITALRCHQPGGHWVVQATRRERVNIGAYVAGAAISFR